MPLTPKQTLFVAEYLIELNATRACKAAGYTQKSAGVCACKLLEIAKVAEAIAEGASKRLTGLEIDADRVVKEIARLAFFDPRKYGEPAQ